MFRHCLRMAGLLLPRFSKQECGVALAIFLMFQAMLPSYAAALSSSNHEDGLILCTSHGLINVSQQDVPKTPHVPTEEDGLCVLAQLAGFGAHIAPVIELDAHDAGLLVLPNVNEPFSGYSRLDDYRPQAQRAPPQVI
ncbi:DUF2946 family protein [Maritalea mediterranea]|uniref:DUF2946 domain-containing protein n=1 Tax=Maritalea mediterranea TaxID=2909667 RepID=A0ABS9ED38_9HYPH|nr:DUF2946 family protein [Maritalea mediterranea]MCF4099675.1 hypothetical protein [Maritalea mediterranea]